MLSALLLAAAPQPQDAPPGHVHPVQHLVSVEIADRDAGRLRALDLDVAHVTRGREGDRAALRVAVIVTPGELERLADSGLRHRVLIEDLARWYARRLAQGGPDAPAGPYGGWLSPPFGQGGMGGYYTFGELVSVLDQMSAAYPSLMTTRTSLGPTIEGRNLWMVKISDNPSMDEPEPEVRFDSLHHAREPEGMQSTLWFMLFLLEEYGSDPLATYLVDERELYFVPCVNPDGYEYNRQIAPGGGGMWRKNRRDNGGGSFGVDLNRNYPYKWAYDDSGSSSDPNSQVYRGPAPASEPETAAMVSFLAGHQFQTALSVHTYSNLWLAPWGYDTLYPSNWPEFDEVGILATEVNGYPHGPASILLYKANGVTIDHDLGTHGTLSWTPEIGSVDDGFWPPQSRIVPLAEDNLVAFWRTALAGGAWVRLETLVLTDAGDGDGSFEVGEPVEIVAQLRNSGRLGSGAVDLWLSSPSPDVTITDPAASLGPLAGFSSGANSTPLRLWVRPGTAAGTIVPITLTVTYDGYSADFDGQILVGTEVILAAFDFEPGDDQGWSLGSPNDATTGKWVRVDPRGTAAQPEDDHTPSPGVKCWVTGQGPSGGGLGDNDVDNGSTTLVSPIFDLDAKGAPRIRYWRWYSNDEGSAPNADVFQVDLSSDGGQTWVAAETVGPAGPEASGGWFAASLDVGSLVTPTSQVRIRFIASDLGSGSIVEAALDDVQVTYYEGDPCPPPTTYCTTSPNSVGAGALISWSGSTQVSDATFTLIASDAVPGQFGLFAYGDQQGTNAVGNGTLCIAGGALFRLPVVKLDGAGQVAHTLDFGAPPASGILGGSTWNFQFWYRDPGVGAGFNFSDALRAVFCD